MVPGPLAAGARASRVARHGGSGRDRQLDRGERDPGAVMNLPAGWQKPTWRRFEEEIAQVVAHFGYAGEVTPPGGDGGIDVIARGGRGKVIIQCKLFAGHKVGRPEVAQLAGVGLTEKA